ncbi:MAG TPA: hypothetical protein VK154_01140 [Chitinophagales bacterium]|nr:hypothetical protein [Chitinophagales bacterium]
MKQLTIAALLLLLLQACQKDKANPTPESATASEYFFPMKTGNYWVYKITDSNYATPTVTYDTLRVIGDTSINGTTFYQLKTSNMQMIPNGSFVGESSGYIVYSDGKRFPLSLVANDTISLDSSAAPYYFRVYKSGSLDTAIAVPSGSFQAAESILNFYYLQGPPPPPNTNPRPILSYFAKNVGLVKCVTWYASGPGSIVSELESYYIQP